MNAIGLQIQEAIVSPESGQRRVSRESCAGGTSLSAFLSIVPISGKGVLHVAYQGKISRNSSAGVFQLKEDREWYVYSQFEPTDARRAFPCFDEPSFKVPWQMTLHVPKDDLALSNTPVQSESSEAERHEDGAIQGVASAAELSGGIGGRTLRRRGCGPRGRDAGAGDRSKRQERARLRTPPRRFRNC